MKIKTPYERYYKSKSEEYEEKIKKRNETEEWIFGNKFGKLQSNNLYRGDRQGNQTVLCSYLHSGTERN